MILNYMPSATKNLFEKRFLDFQKLLISETSVPFAERLAVAQNVRLNKSFLGGKGGRFFKKAPLVAEGKK